MFFKKSMTGLSDEELINKASGGSERALQEIYHRYATPLLRYFYRMLWQDKKKAEDFSHDLFIKIMESSSRFDTSKKFSTWIYSVAHNMCKNEYRKQAFRRTLQLPMNSVYTSEAITSTLDHTSFQKRLEDILVQEGDEARTIFILRHELDMTFAEIGEVVGCPEGTVKSRLFYLKKKLAQSLDPYKVILEK
jgi:RNA polymerase sigma-70 factor (ECF subfamily)